MIVDSVPITESITLERVSATDSLHTLGERVSKDGVSLIFVRKTCAACVPLGNPHVAQCVVVGGWECQSKVCCSCPATTKICLGSVWNTSTSMALTITLIANLIPYLIKVVVNALV